MVSEILKIIDLQASVLDENDNAKDILNGVSLALESSKVNVIMGPNGSGKSTLAQVIMGHPGFRVTGGDIDFNGESILEMSPEERALKGIFLSFQYPSEIPGVTISNFLRMIYNKQAEVKLTPSRFRKYIQEKLELLDMKEDFLNRYLNEGFSGGEKKRMEMLQMLVLEPKLAILDEVDSGLDIDALQVVAKAVNYLHEKNGMTVLLITHYSRILKHIEADKLFILQAGKIVRIGGKELASELEEHGYAITNQ